MSLFPKRIALTCAVGLVAISSLSNVVYGGSILVVAQTESTPPAEQSVQPARRQRVEKPKSATPKPAAATPAAAAPTPPGASPLPSADLLVSQKLAEAGAGCTGRIESIAREALAGVKGFVPVSSWHAKEPKKHVTAVVVGQNYGPDAKAPFGLTGIVGAPGASGERCDGYTFQVIPSPLSCVEIQTSFLKSGTAVADLGGFPLLRDAKNQVALIPSAGGGGCVVVSFHTDY